MLAQRKGQVIKMRISFKFVLTVVIYSNLANFVHSIQTQFVTNERPIIGILAQEVYNKSDYSLPPTQSYIAASYVKYLEGAGARVVPILVNQDQAYLKKIFEQINGILIPGGAILFDYDNGTVANTTKGFVKSGLYLLNLAKDANNKGDYFPVWGTCLGFEFMLFAEGNGEEVRTLCKANNQIDKLKFQREAAQSRLFGSARKSIVNALASKPISVNFHHFCVTPEGFEKFGLNNSYKLLSTSYDPAGNITYVSAIEHRRYPFFGVQFHPEKNIYEWTKKENIPHSPEAIDAAQYFAKFFVDEARKSTHSFISAEEEETNLIYNYCPTNTGAMGLTFNQMYFFPFSF